MGLENIFNGIYNNKKVLITGNTGFKGSWLTLFLKLLGAKIYGFAMSPPTDPNLYEDLNLHEDIEYYKGDIRDRQKLIEVVRKISPDIIFHMAAQPLVRESYNNPVYTYETNVIGTMNLMEAVREVHSTKVLINITTDKCYENKETIYGYREDDNLGGFDPYSSSKACSEIITSAYRNSFFSNFDKREIYISTARAGNVIGGGDWALDRLVPDCFRALSNNKKILIRNPEQIRPWQHVLEPLSGYLWLAAIMYTKGNGYTGAWNFGPKLEDIKNVQQIVEDVIKYWGKGEYAILEKSGPHETGLLRLDTTKSQFKLAWNPVYSVEDAIENTVDWYKGYYRNKNNLKEFTINQIIYYTSKAKDKKMSWAL